MPSLTIENYNETYRIVYLLPFPRRRTSLLSVTPHATPPPLAATLRDGYRSLLPRSFLEIAVVVLAVEDPHASLRSYLNTLSHFQPEESLAASAVSGVTLSPARGSNSHLLVCLIPSATLDFHFA
ncbi:hypothetical protein QL285_033047 [Trifolium repens]|nr:hypothetical protein QL285_033047 [Trifolium repens]